MIATVFSSPNMASSKVTIETGFLKTEDDTREVPFTAIHYQATMTSSLVIEDSLEEKKIFLNPSATQTLNGKVSRPPLHRPQTGG
jgi:hypothetical protein